VAGCPPSARFSKARDSPRFNRILRSVQQGHSFLQTQCRTVVAGKTLGDGRARRGSPVAHGHAYAGYLARYYSMSTREYDSLSKSLPIWSTVLYAASALHCLPMEARQCLWSLPRFAQASETDFDRWGSSNFTDAQSEVCTMLDGSLRNKVGLHDDDCQARRYPELLQLAIYTHMPLSLPSITTTGSMV
jgi:hypothetical protein